MNDREKYRQAFLLQKALRQFERVAREHRQFNRHLGPADERCTRCGGAIETLLNSEGRNPLRCCWRCEVADMERENTRDQ
jgi:hypothetical protein